MGSFSWLRADVTTERANLTHGDKYKILIPEEFGGGFIEDVYEDYGNVFAYDESKETADLYGILAYWNKCDGMDYEGDEYPSTMEDILKRGKTKFQSNRSKGIRIGCYDYQIAQLRYPLKLVSASYKGTYEECPHRSYGDPDQGFYKTHWRNYRKCTRYYESDKEYENRLRTAAYDEKDKMIEEYKTRKSATSDKGIITLRKFKAFVKVQASGVTNMWNSRYVCAAANLSHAEYMEIMRHYEVYEKMFDVHVEDYERDMSNLNSTSETDPVERSGNLIFDKDTKEETVETTVDKICKALGKTVKVIK